MTTLDNLITIVNNSNAIKTNTLRLLDKYNKWFNDFMQLDPKTMCKDDFFEFITDAEAWDFEMTQYDLIQYVHPDKKLRNTSVIYNRKVNSFFSKWDLNKDIYNIYLKFYEYYKEDFDFEEKEFMLRKINSGRHIGIHLSEEKRKKIDKINEKLDDLCLTYMKNLNNYDQYLSFTEEELTGIKNIEAISHTGTKYKVNASLDIIGDILTNCLVEETRKKVWEFFSLRGKSPYKNQDLLQKIVKYRQEKAEELGYRTFAEWKLSYRRMAKSVKQVNHFLDDLTDIIEDKSSDELKMIGRTFDKNRIEAWNVKFYGNIYRGSIGLDQNKIKEYLPLEEILPRIMKIFEELFGLKIIEVRLTNKTTWHKDVTAYKVTDKRTKQIMGFFYLDLFPRDGKNTHVGATFPLKNAYYKDGKRQTPIALMLCNFTRPTREKPSLLTFWEFSVFFHELGHVFHDLLGNNRFSLFNGSNVELDFVECPSQALEYWCYDEEFLKEVTVHYETGEPLPNQMIKDINKYRYLLYFSTYYQPRVIKSIFDMEIHSGFKKNEDIEHIYTNIQNQISKIKYGKECIPANFEHMVDGYSVGYYGYLWSEAYAYDIYNYFKKSGSIMNKKIGMRYRKKILEVGGLLSGEEILYNFFDREPSKTSFFNLLRNIKY